MSFETISLEQAISASGLRMVVPQGIPSPWCEAVKGFFHLRGISWQALYLDQRNDAMKQWTGKRSAPVLMVDNQPPVHHWQDILTFVHSQGEGAELLPQNLQKKQQVMALCGSLMDKNGLAWNRRLVCIDKGLKQQQGGYPEFIAKYLGNKYGYDESHSSRYVSQVCVQLQQLSQQLLQQSQVGSRFLVGEQLSAADIYCACVMAFFKPLEHELCAMSPVIREVFESLSEAEQKALNPILIHHRDFIYQNYLELPLSL
ncbi:hypothetical protein A3759_10755 [Thalassolituus sp. HI0120]|nr:hypothetical protein A3759_10755 [Thalassolituus sp. HI0120]